jgi:hypothetical protein
MKLTATRKRFAAAAQRREVRARAGAPLEQHSLGFGQVHDRIHAVLHGVDEASGALRLGLHSHVEPHRRIESHLLLDQKMRQFIVESMLGFRVGEVAAFHAPADDRVSHAADQLAHRSLALGGVRLAVKIFRRDNVRRRLRPGLRHFHIFLPEDHLAFVVADQRVAQFPFDRVERMHLAVGEPTLEFQTSSALCRSFHSRI